jgi:hypothetical protein
MALPNSSCTTRLLLAVALVEGIPQATYEWCLATGAVISADNVVKFASCFFGMLLATYVASSRLRNIELNRDIGNNRNISQAE